MMCLTLLEVVLKIFSGAIVYLIGFLLFCCSLLSVFILRTNYILDAASFIQENKCCEKDLLTNKFKSFVFLWWMITSIWLKIVCTTDPLIDLKLLKLNGQEVERRL